jgi:hypothetical protein
MRYYRKKSEERKEQKAESVCFLSIATGHVINIPL